MTALSRGPAAMTARKRCEPISPSWHGSALLSPKGDAGLVAVPDLPDLQESTILVPVPEAEPVVGQLRARLDRAAIRGIPAHVTVLYPFVRPGQITLAVIDKAAAAVASVQGFDCRFAGTGWFGDQAVWLAPEPAGPFRALTAAVHAAFPQCPPFGGAFAEVIPH
jgi:2'-5' RNA ligase superfamily